MPDVVARHFSRSVKDIARLNSPSVQIEVFDLPFLRRDEYMQGLRSWLANLISSGSPCQHKTNRKKDASWIDSKQKQFEGALGLPIGAAKMARGERATDVVFFFAQKT
jgi:hypothetical protein